MLPVLLPWCADLETFGSTRFRATAPLPCEDVDGVETTYFLSQTLQSKHESHTSQKRSCTTATDTACSDPATTCKASENHVPRNGAYNHFCPKPWKHALSGRPPLACHRLWDWAVPLRLDASSSLRLKLAGMSDKINMQAQYNYRAQDHPSFVCRCSTQVQSHWLSNLHRHLGALSARLTVTPSDAAYSSCLHFCVS